MSHKSRRASLTTSALAMSTAASVGPARGANDRIRLGLIGCGGRGQYLMRTLNKLGGIEWVSVCDVWNVRREEAAELAGSPVEMHTDHRYTLDRQDVDAVIIATPDHWHAQMTIDSVRAGKDAYVEKPMTSAIDQGPKVVGAVRETGRIVMVGAEQRSNRHFLEAKERIVNAGLLGKVGLVRTWHNSSLGFVNPVPPGMEKQPAGLDWDRYLGWLPKTPWDPKRYFNHFAYWDISTGGPTGGLFVHLIDTVHWYLNLKRPEAAVAAGGTYFFDDGRDTPDVISCALEYPGGLTVTFEAELFSAPKKGREPAAGIEFRGSGGVLLVNRDSSDFGYSFTPASDEKAADVVSGPGSPPTAEPHLQRWLDRLRDRQPPIPDVVDGHYAAMACHIANLAYRCHSRVEWDRTWDV